MAIRLIAKRYLVKLLLWIVINPANSAVACGLSEYVSPTHPADTMTLPVILAAWGCFRGVEGGKDYCQAMCHLLRPGIRPTLGAHTSDPADYRITDLPVGTLGTGGEARPCNVQTPLNVVPNATCNTCSSYRLLPIFLTKDIASAPTLTHISWQTFTCKLPGAVQTLQNEETAGTRLLVVIRSASKPEPQCYQNAPGLPSFICPLSQPDSPRNATSGRS
jgi:hypothetical protein